MQSLEPHATGSGNVTLPLSEPKTCVFSIAAVNATTPSLSQFVWTAIGDIDPYSTTDQSMITPLQSLPSHL